MSASCHTGSKLLPFFQRWSVDNVPISKLNIQPLRDLLATSVKPLYAVDSQGRIVFANEPLARWTGRTIDQLIGLVCRYHSEAPAESAAAVAAALCPPPSVFEGQACQQTIHLSGPAGNVLTARARFLPVAVDDAAGHFVLATLNESTADDSIKPEDSPLQLHATLQVLRARQAGTKRFSRFLGTSPISRQTRGRLELAVGSQANVLLVGLPGMQTNLTARELVSESDRGRLLQVVEGAWADAEVLRELFAQIPESRRRSEGTPDTLLCFDADQLSAEAQLALETELESRAESLRVISTAARSLEELAAEERFRLGLACRLSTLEIHLPSLADCGQDLAIVVQALIEEQNASGEKQVTGFSREALAILAEYCWPGEMQELANLVGEAHRRALGATIIPAELPPRLVEHARGGPPTTAPAPRIDLEEFLAEIETRLLRRALQLNKGNKTKAARMLGMTRPRLYRRLVQRGLEQPPPPGATAEEIQELEWLDEPPA